MLINSSSLQGQKPRGRPKKTDNVSAASSTKGGKETLLFKGRSQEDVERKLTLWVQNLLLKEGRRILLFKGRRTKQIQRQKEGRKVFSDSHYSKDKEKLSDWTKDEDVQKWYWLNSGNRTEEFVYWLRNVRMNFGQKRFHFVKKN